ncbi:MAG: alpha/beta hydrolase, partial [Gaiellaceae bacterium]
CKLATQGLSVEAVVAACLGATTADVTHYRTPDAMDDLDAVRQALGYDRIDVWGGSYGATAVYVYLRRHPETVRTWVVDGPTLLDVPVFERWSSSAQRALDLLHKRCHASRACARAFPTWYERFPALLAKLARRPVKVGTLTLDAALVAGTIDELTANVASATDVPFLLAKAERGTYTPLVLAYYRLPSGSPGEVALMPWAIMCTEPWATRDPAKVAADAAHSNLRYSEPAFALLAKQVCDAWPKVDTSGEDWSRVQSELPGLVLVGGADPKDPPTNSAGVTQVMPNAKVITVPGGAHGVSQEGCLPQLLDRFFERGTAQGLDTSCAAKALVPYPPFRLR